MLKPSVARPFSFFMASAARPLWRRRKAMPKTKYHLLDRRADQITTFTQNIPDDQLLTTRQVAAMLGVSEQLVEKLRAKNEGPEWTALGPRCIRYRMGNVRIWLGTRIKLHLRTLTERQKMTAHMNRRKRITNTSAGA